MSTPATAQPARNSPAMMNVLVNPASAGRPRITSPATKVAAICPPSAPPSVRSTVFIPLATPVWSRGTACTIRLPSAEKASPIPTPSSAELTSMPYGWRLVSVSQMQASAPMIDPVISAHRELNRRSTRPASEPSTPMPTAHGQQVHPGGHHRGAVAEPGAGGQLGQLGEQQEERVQPPPSRKAARLTVHTPRTRIRAMSTSGLLLRSSTMIHTAQTARPAASRPRVRALVQPQTEVCAIAISTQHMPVLISAAATQLTRPGAGPRRRDEQAGADGGHQHHRQRDPEQPVPVQVLDRSGRRSPGRSPRRCPGWPTSARCCPAPARGGTHRG